MENELGIIGYKKIKKSEKTTDNIILEIIPIYFLSSLIVTACFFCPDINTIISIIITVVAFIFCVIFTLIEILSTSIPNKIIVLTINSFDC